MITRAPTYFFIHVMKTGGTTFVQHILANFSADAVYPSSTRGEGRKRAYYMIDELRRISLERRGSLRAYSGHFPFVAAELVGADVTLAILRDPIERTVSILRHHRREDPRLHGATLEEVYDDGWVFPLYVHNYQAKLFAMTVDDKLESHLDLIDVDEARLEIALTNLERVDVLGLHHRYAEFLDTMREQQGWTIGDVPDLRVSADRRDVPSQLRERIAADNAAEMTFYEHAVRLYERRQGGRVSRPLASLGGVDDD
jgi:hypothetical protein